MLLKVSRRAPQMRQSLGKTRFSKAAGSFRAAGLSTVVETGVSHRLLKIHLQRNNILLQDWFGRIRLPLTVLDFSGASFRMCHLYQSVTTRWLSTAGRIAPCRIDSANRRDL